MARAVGSKYISLSPGEVDYVLVYTTESDVIKRFLEQVQSQHEIFLDTETHGEYHYVKLRASFNELCTEAEKIKLEMPLAGAKAAKPKGMCGCLNDWIERTFVTDDEDDYVSAPFVSSELDKFKGYQDKKTFFRRSLRSYLVHHMLCNMDVQVGEENGQESSQRCSVPSCCRLPRNSGFKKKKGLNYFLMKNIFTDAFVLHEDPQTLAIPPRYRVSIDQNAEQNGSVVDQASLKLTQQMSQDSTNYFYVMSDTGSLYGDKGTQPKNVVTEMFDKWTSWKNFYRFQPMWKIRNYFGEKIAFYFAWTGMLVSSLWIPTFLGIMVFIYGIILRFRPGLEEIMSQQANETVSFKVRILEIMKIVGLTFDNDVTPYFAMIVCIWGTVFLEMWKRRSARLAYEWDVNDFQAAETDRPQFVGTASKYNPVGEETVWYYPFRFQLFKFMLSVAAALAMIGFVVASLLGVIVYRVTMEMDVCPKAVGEQCLMFKTVFSSVLNAISITALGKMYYHLAIWLTKTENHKTQSKYDDALIIKLFAFQFANNYSSCFYIAFFVERMDTSVLIGRGSEYQDTCEGTCMSQLTFLVIALMLIKPMPKLFTDIILPKLMKLWSRCTCSSCCCSGSSKGPIKDVDVPLTSINAANEKSCTVCGESIQAVDDNGSNKHVLCRERKKPELGDFTLEEYTEKVIQYGYLMLFAASFPLAPLFALLTNLIDIQVDGWRLLTIYRRPLAFIAQDIGMWYKILVFVNYCGVLSNAFLIAFTSSWGQSYDLVGKLVIVIGFEHIVFVLKYMLAYLIPDVPVDVQEAIRQEKYETRKLFLKSQEKLERRKSL